ncbi:MAG: class I SAM-dependent methyltransferase [Holosporaceae bacterium]|jgi:SAM-dependent methyltransferase|nr:class I SAM-dependent methyltransferase [Holosporaceae bacterium]
MEYAKSISSLTEFYEKDMGQELVKQLADLLSSTLNIANENVLVIGFGREYLESLRIKNVYYAIPNGYPVGHWPRIRPFRTIVIDEKSMPFQPHVWDVVMVIHFMEFCENNTFFLEELQRIIRNKGRLIIVAANKNSIFPKKYAIRNIKISVGDMLSLLDNASFEATNIFGINDKFKFWPNSFSHHLNKCSEVIVDIFPLISNIVVIMAEKMKLADIPLKALVSVTTVGAQ